VAEVRKVITGNAHLALIGTVGTPTTQATQPVATEAALPMIGPFTGAGFLRNADLGNIYNVRASYDAETEAWIKHLVDGSKDALPHPLPQRRGRSVPRRDLSEGDGGFSDPGSGERQPRREAQRRGHGKCVDRSHRYLRMVGSVVSLPRKV
jgi:hypothetical protein